MIFLPSTADDLPAASQDASGVVRLYFTAERLATVVDQLRNESPIKLAYWYGPGANSHIGTSKREPVGEDE